MRRVLSLTPLYPIDLFLDLKRLEVVKLGLVGLELGVELVFATSFLQTKTLALYSRAENVFLALARRVVQTRSRRCVRFMNATDLGITLEQDHSTALVARREVIARMVKLNSRNNVGCTQTERP